MPSTFTRKEIERILESSKQKWETYIFCRLLWETGARIAEIMLLTPSDVHSTNGTIRIHTLRRKYESHRIVSVSPDFVRELFEFIGKRGIDPQKPILRFTTRTALKYFKMACLDADISLENALPSKMRHSRAVHLIDQGYRIENIAGYMGTRDIHRFVSYYVDPSRSNLVFEAIRP